MSRFEACLQAGLERERTHWERTRERVYGFYGRKIEQNGGRLPAVCYQIKAYDGRGNPFRSTECIDIEDRCDPGWWERVRGGVVGHPAARREYGSKWVIDEDESERVERVV